ncbi:MAG: hypothetical protein AAF268_00710 [Cyanobacteria bacterium P01_A01_bin.3]
MANLVNRLLDSHRKAPNSERNRTPEALVDCMSTAVRSSLTVAQLDEIKRLVAMALPKPSPKLIDLRFTLDVLFARYFIVLWVGKDRRQNTRSYPRSRLTVVANRIAVALLLIGCNLAISGSILLVLYLLKSALGINLMPGHLRELYR